MAREQGEGGAGGARQSYLGPVWRRWPISLVLPVAAGVAAYFLSGLFPKSYRGESKVVISRVDYGREAMNLSAITPGDCQVFFTSPEVMAKVAKAEQLAEKHGIEASRLGSDYVTVSVPRGSNRVKIQVKMPSAKLAQDVATRLATEGVSACQTTMHADYEAMLSKLGRDADEAEKALRDAETALMDVRSKSRIEIRGSWVGMLRRLSVQPEVRRIEVETELAVERAKIAAYEKRLKAAAATPGGGDALTASPPLKQALADLLDLQTVEALASAKTKEDALAAELAGLIERKAESDKELADLEKELFEQERELREKTFRRDQAQQAVRDVAEALRTVRNVPKWPPISMTVTPATLPTRPVSPRRVRMSVAVLGLVGFFTWALAFLLERRALRG